MQPRERRPYEDVLTRVFGPADEAFLMIMDQLPPETSQYQWQGIVKGAAAGAVASLMYAWFMVGAARPPNHTVMMTDDGDFLLVAY